MLDEIPELADVLDARRVIEPHIDRTPLRRYPLLDDELGWLHRHQHQNQPAQRRQLPAELYGTGNDLHEQPAECRRQ